MSSNAASEIANIEKQALDCVAENLSIATNNELAITNQITKCLE